jgi:hypothetical protein
MDQLKVSRNTKPERVTNSSNPVDALIGRKVMLRRVASALDADRAAAEIGIATDQYVASEAGRRRFCASELLKLAKLFNVSPSAFFTR